MIVRRTPDFEKCIEKYDFSEDERRLIDKALRLFATDPKYPGLWHAKLEGHPGCYYIRAGRRIRLVYRLEGEEALFWWVGAKPDFEHKF